MAAMARAGSRKRFVGAVTGSGEDGGEAIAALEAVKKHPLIKPMLYPPNKINGDAAEIPQTKSGRLKTSQKTDFPSYIPSRTFSAALLGLGEVAAVSGDVDLHKSMRKLGDSIEAIPSEPVRQALKSLLTNAQGDAVTFRRNVEQWYDDQMDRVSGWYKKRVHKVLWVLAFVVAFTLNADALQIGKRLWVDPSQRAAIVSQAQNATKTTNGEDPSDKLGSLPIPLGWHLASARHDPQGFPFYEQPSMVWTLFAKLIGLAITAVAITFGAPFWFDTLSKLARLRNSGAPPPSSDALSREDTSRAPVSEPTPMPESEPEPKPKPKPKATRRGGTTRPPS